MELTTKSPDWDERLTCDRCGLLLGYGLGDFNATAILCPSCYEKLPPPRESK